jgi:putative membrane protein
MGKYNGQETWQHGTAGTYTARTDDAYPATVQPTVVAPAAVATTVIVPNTNGTTSTVLVPSGSTANGAIIVPNTGAYTTATTTTGTTVLVPVTQVPASVVVGADADFKARAAAFDATEIALSRVAFQRSPSAQVQAFAAQTIATHRRMADDLDSVALRQNVSLTWAPNPAGNAAVGRIASRSGSDLDRAYLDQIIADYQAGAALYQAEAAQASDVTLRSSVAGDAVDLRSRLNDAVRLRNAGY